jgi:hypothetical protein
MDKVQKRSNSEHYTPSSEPFRTYNKPDHTINKVTARTQWTNHSQMNQVHSITIITTTSVTTIKVTKTVIFTTTTTLTTPRGWLMIRVSWYRISVWTVVCSGYQRRTYRKTMKSSSMIKGSVLGSWIGYLLNESLQRYLYTALLDYFRPVYFIPTPLKDTDLSWRIRSY